jgi:ubiquinone/menaquinone biosynthesis C-methylase UbiE
VARGSSPHVRTGAAAHAKCGVKDPTSERKRPRLGASAGDDDGNDAKIPPRGRPRSFPAVVRPLAKLMGIDQIRRAVLDRAELQRGQRVLDVGCGTGSLLLTIKQCHPDVDVVGLDPDPKALARARRKFERRHLDVQLDRGFANALSYGDASFDRVFSSFMYHHLDAQQQKAMLSEVRRVSKPGGRFEFVDFAGREHGGHRNWIHSHERLAGNTESNVTALLQRSGFADVRVAGRHAKFFGTVIHYQASQA